MDTYEVWDYLQEQDLDQQFAELDAQQVQDLKALGVPEAEAPTEYGGGPVFTGRSFFRWWDDPLIIHT